MKHFFTVFLLIFSTQCFSQMCTANFTPEQVFLQLTNQNEQISTKSPISSTNLININTATESELVQLHGISSKKAQEIILYRSMIAPFATVDDLDKVKGIGKATIDKNRHLITVR